PAPLLVVVDDLDVGHRLERRAEPALGPARPARERAEDAVTPRQQRHDAAGLAVVEGAEDDGVGADDHGAGDAGRGERGAPGGGPGWAGPGDGGAGIRPGRVRAAGPAVSSGG